jgi:hypothetical protein
MMDDPVMRPTLILSISIDLTLLIVNKTYGTEIEFMIDAERKEALVMPEKSCHSGSRGRYTW